jgi:hypothetical protein
MDKALIGRLLLTKARIHPPPLPTEQISLPQRQETPHTLQALHPRSPAGCIQDIPRRKRSANKRNAPGRQRHTDRQVLAWNRHPDRAILAA